MSLTPSLYQALSVLIGLRMITFNWSNYRRKEDAAEVPGHLLLMQGLRQELSQTKNYMHILSCYNWMAFVLLVYNHVHRILLVLHTTTLWYRFLRRKTDNGHNDHTRHRGTIPNSQLITYTAIHIQYFVQVWWASSLHYAYYVRLQRRKAKYFSKFELDPWGVRSGWTSHGD